MTLINNNMLEENVNSQNIWCLRAVRKIEILNKRNKNGGDTTSKDIFIKFELVF